MRPWALPTRPENRLGRSLAYCLALLLYAGTLTVRVGAGETPPGEATWEMDSLARAVQPLQHGLGGRLPLLLWNYPIPIGNHLLESRADGRLAGWLRLAAERGLALPVQIGWVIWTPEGALAQAKTTRELGLPLFLCVDELPGGNAGLYRQSRLWPLGPDSRRPHVRRWPCLALADAGEAAAGVRRLMEEYRTADLSPTGVFFEHEGFPHPWFGVYDAQRTCPRCAAHYPAGVLDDERRFIEHIYDLRSRILSQAIADPVHAVFPQALVGNYDEWASSRRVPYLSNGGEALPPRSLGRLNALMPRAYASPWYLHQFFPDTPEVGQAQADPIYFNLLLNTISTTCANRRPGQVVIPYLARDDPFDPLRRGDRRFAPGMSHALYRELIRHALLRGTDGFYLYTLGFPGSGVETAEAWGTIEDTRSVYDTLLNFRDCLDHGQVMTYQTHPPRYGGPVWSGVRLRDRCLVRVFTLDARPGEVTLQPFPGVWVTLPAPLDGALYEISDKGKARRAAAP